MDKFPITRDKTALTTFAAMLTLLDIRPLQYAGPDSEKSLLICSVAAALTRDKAVKWLFAADHTYQPGSLPALPTGDVLVKRALPGRMGWRYWYDWQLPRLARQYNADLIMPTGGIIAKPTVPQCIWMPERVDLAMYGRRQARGLQQAATIICYTERDKSRLAGLQPGLEDRVLVMHPAPAEGPGPLSMEDRAAIKTALTGGKEYFLADLAEADLDTAMNILKAFSLFKKRLQSNMQLVFRNSTPVVTSQIKERLETYKYRQDVHWTSGIHPAGQVTGAAYAILFPMDGHTLGTPLFEAWRMAVPAIVASGSLLQELSGEAALDAGNSPAPDPDSPAALAAQLVLIYKDEDLRRKLIIQGLARLEAFSREWPKLQFFIWQPLQSISM